MAQHRTVSAAAALARERARRLQRAIAIRDERGAICAESEDVTPERAEQVALCEAHRSMWPHSGCSCGAHPPTEAA